MAKKSSVEKNKRRTALVKRFAAKRVKLKDTANNLSLPFAQLAYAYEARGDRARAIENLTRADRLSTNPALGRALQTLIATPRGDSARTDSGP